MARCEHCGVDPQAMETAIVNRIFDGLANSGLSPVDYFPIIALIVKILEQPE